MAKLTTVEFIKKAIARHGDKYGYGKVNYIDSKIKVDIFCRNCETYFPQPPNKHLYGQGCPEYSCGGTKKLTHDEFVENARKKHGNKYSYPEKYIGAKTVIMFKCNDCGNSFRIRPNSHLNGKGGCSFCHSGAQSNKDDFIRKAVMSHEEGHYSYNKFIYVKAKIVGIIHCNIHNVDFECAPYNHLACFNKEGDIIRKGKGCKICGRKKTIDGSKKTFAVFFNETLEIHKGKYEYDPDSYFGVKENMHMYCYDHGWFKQTPDCHINGGQGCPVCKYSHGERIVGETLMSLAVNFKGQYVFDCCKNKRKLPFDFAVLNKNILLKGLIEFHGRQHFKTIEYFGGKKGFTEINKNDQIKSDFCDFNGIPFLVIPYYKIEETNTIVKSFLKRIKNKKPITGLKKPAQLTIF